MPDDWASEPPSLAAEPLLRRGAAVMLHHVAMRACGPHELVFGADARRILSSDNAGGSSTLSEALSCELLGRVFERAALLCTELQVAYARPCAIVDYTARLGDARVGVSVTRFLGAAAAQRAGVSIDEAARRLVAKKMRGLQDALNGVAERDLWQRGVLHVFVQSAADAHRVADAYMSSSSLDMRTSAMWITVMPESAAWLFRTSRRASNAAKTSGRKAAASTAAASARRHAAKHEAKAAQRGRSRRDAHHDAGDDDFAVVAADTSPPRRGSRKRR